MPMRVLVWCFDQVTAFFAELERDILRQRNDPRLAAAKYYATESESKRRSTMVRPLSVLCLVCALIVLCVVHAGCCLYATDSHSKCERQYPIARCRLLLERC